MRATIIFILTRAYQPNVDDNKLIMLSVHETGIKMQLVYIRKTLAQKIRNLRYRVEPSFSGYPRGITGLPLENDKKRHVLS